MDEDAGVRAPVTRLRRRMSVEQTEEKSPAVSTPTKKRGGRRTAKPDLELIDENTPDNTTSKRTTKKTSAKDIIDAVEEKPVTPSRRSTRIKSNTSIVSETAVVIDSPRAKRAARRTSQIGSDSEAPGTPVRQTRRTRKDSTSSIEKSEIQIKPIQISEVIAEEPENLRKSTSNVETNDSSSPTNLRKSPRLMQKTKKGNSKDTEKDDINQATDTIIASKENTPSKKSIESPVSNSQEFNTEQTMHKDRLSTSSSNLIENLNTEGKSKLSNLNKSTTAIDSKKNNKTKRVRTKSWTTNTASIETNFYSDNESVKEKNSKENKVPIIQINKLEAGDSLNTSLNHDKSISKKKKRSSSSIIVESIDTSMTNISTKSIEKNNEEIDVPHASNNQSNVDETDNATRKLFDKEPSSAIQTMVYIEDDSDTNSVKIKNQNRHENEDQCVPVVENPNEIEKGDSPAPFIPDKKETSFSNKSKSMIMNNSCEPMDIDETIPENLQMSQIKTNDNNLSNIKSISIHQLDTSDAGKKELNKSKRKSSISNTPNKTENENKSTLILSQLKDSSSGDVENVKSPQIKNSILSKTVDDLNSTQDIIDNNKKNISLTCVTTSTPLQQKRLQKLGNINTSIITDIDGKDKIDKSVNKTKNEVSDKVENNEKEEKRQEERENMITTSNTKLDLNKSSTNKSKSENELGNNKNNSIKKKNITITENDSEDSDEAEEKSNKDVTNKKQNQKLKKSQTKKSLSVTSKNYDSDSNDELNSNDEMDSDDESQENSNMLDDIAEDAGDDYESGDSQDEEERRYIKDNEILEKGETLTSEDDISNDSEYEKDSFVVSSDPEDDELLEGTEDDLSMSDNELKMNAKSKKKYNERKSKEAKKASREMYESRHKLNSSNKSNSSEIGKIKKNKHQQFSSSESEEEEAVKIKKPNRMRLDSSHETSLLDKDDSKNSSKKSKRLSESVCEENVTNEKEITIANETMKDIDPLANIKIEPKTPQNNASIAFINTENDPDDSELTKTQTELVDPLDDSMGEDSLSSDNENIMQNYDSVLEGLNKSKKTKSKLGDISLNIEKKKSKKEKTIIDELNLTQVKSAKKTKNKDNKQNENIAKNKKASKPDLGEGDSSDSIDLHLLFSEDSSNSEDVQNKKKNISVINEEFTPLKNTEGKTNLRENADKVKKGETSFNLSLNKKDKEKKIETASASDEADNNSASFFIDTEGTHSTMNKSQTTNSNNKKTVFSDSDDDDSDSKNEEPQKKNINENKTDADENSDSDAPMDVPFKKEKAKSLAQEEENGEDETDFAGDKSYNRSIAKTPGSEKKKKSKDSQNSEQIETENIPEESMNVTLSSSKKKKKKSISETVENEQTEKETSIQINDKSLIKTPGSHKKKLSESNVYSEDNENENPNEKSVSKTPKSEKKKKRNSLSVENDQTEEQSLNISKIKTPGSQKKKKLAIETEDVEQQDISEVLSISKIKTPGSQKKKNNTDSSDQNDKVKTDQNETLGSAKKNKKTHSSSFTLDNEISAAAELYANDDTNSKKRKRKSSLVPSEDNIPKDDLNTSQQLNESLIGSQKKKRKISQNDETIPDDINNKLNESLVGKKKRKVSQNNDNVPAVESAPEENKVPLLNLSSENKNEPGPSGTAKKNKSRKRKQREEDEGDNIVKVFKENSFDKVPVPRLPANILSQLDDKPKQAPAKKLKVISTSNFSVEEAKKRKNKPSNYLEETICLNDDESEGKKLKKRLQKPKVLPFVPTALTSASGYTTNFKVNVIPRETKFIAQSNTVSNFKDDYLFNKKIKRQGTYELYKRNRNIKISKF